MNKIRKYDRLLTGAILLVSVALFVIGLIVLPETLVVQVSANGTPDSTMPKFMGLLLPFSLSSVFAITYYQTKEPKNLFIAVVGVIVFVLEFVFNI